MNQALKTKDQYEKTDLDNYGNKFDEKAVDDVMEVGAVELEDLETDFGMIEDERERKRRENQVSLPYLNHLIGPSIQRYRAHLSNHPAQTNPKAKRHPKRCHSRRNRCT